MLRDFADDPLDMLPTAHSGLDDLDWGAIRAYQSLYDGSHATGGIRKMSDADFLCRDLDLALDVSAKPLLDLALEVVSIQGVVRTPPEGVPFVLFARALVKAHAHPRSLRPGTTLLPL